MEILIVKPNELEVVVQVSQSAGWLHNKKSHIFDMKKITILKQMLIIHMKSWFVTIFVVFI